MRIALLSDLGHWEDTSAELIKALESVHKSSSCKYYTSSHSVDIALSHKDVRSQAYNHIVEALIVWCIPGLYPHPKGSIKGLYSYDNLEVVRSSGVALTTSQKVNGRNRSSTFSDGGERAGEYSVSLVPVLASDKGVTVAVVQYTVHELDSGTHAEEALLPSAGGNDGELKQIASRREGRICLLGVEIALKKSLHHLLCSMGRQILSSQNYHVDTDASRSILADQSVEVGEPRLARTEIACLHISKLLRSKRGSSISAHASYTLSSLLRASTTYVFLTGEHTSADPSTTAQPLPPQSNRSGRRVTQTHRVVNALPYHWERGAVR